MERSLKLVAIGYLPIKQKRIMKKDFELLKKDTEVIYDGIRTKITGGVIVKLLSNYMEDIWDYLTEKYPEKDFSEGEAWDYDPRFQYFEYDGVGDEYIVLSLDDMSENDIDWEYDYVLIDTSDIPSYLQDLNKIVCLTDIDVAHNIHDLTDEQLKELHGEVCIGSMCYSDYNNSFFLDRSELSGYCESYEEWLEEKGIEDSPEEFSYYMREAA